MTVEKKFLNREVWASRGYSKVRGVVVQAECVWSGNWRLLIEPKNGGIGFWINSRKCKLL